MGSADKMFTEPGSLKEGWPQGQEDLCQEGRDKKTLCQKVKAIGAG